MLGEYSPMSLEDEARGRTYCGARGAIHAARAQARTTHAGIRMPAEEWRETCQARSSTLVWTRLSTPYTQYEYDEQSRRGTRRGYVVCYDDDGFVLACLEVRQCTS